MIVLTLRGTEAECDKAIERLHEVLDIHGDIDICDMEGTGTPGFGSGVRVSAVVTVADKDPEPTEEPSASVSECITTQENETGDVS